MLRGTLATIVFGAMLSPATAQDWARAMFATDAHDFGTVARNAPSEFRFVFTNRYVEDVHVASVTASCGCTSVSIENPTVRTHQQGAIVAKFNTDRFFGVRGATIRVVIDRPLYAVVQLQVRGVVRDDVVMQPESVVLGDLPEGRGGEQLLRVDFTSSNGWRIEAVRSANPHLAGDVGLPSLGAQAVAYALRIRLAKEAPPGHFRDFVRLVTNDAQRTEIPVPVQWRVLPGLQVSPTSLLLGSMRPGETTTRQLAVRAGAPFRVLSVTSQGDALKVSAQVSPEARAVHLVPLSCQASGKPGEASQAIRIATDMEGKVVEVPAYLVIAP